MRKLAVCFALLVLVPAFASASRTQEANKPAAVSRPAGGTLPITNQFASVSVLLQLV